MPDNENLIPNLTPTVQSPNAAQDVAEQSMAQERKARKLKLIAQQFYAGWEHVLRVFKAGGNPETVLKELEEDATKAKFVPKYRQDLAELRTKLIVMGSIPLLNSQAFDDDGDYIEDDEEGFLPR